MSIRDRYKPGGDKYEAMKADIIREKVQESKEQEARERNERIEHAEKYGREIDVWEARNVE